LRVTATELNSLIATNGDIKLGCVVDTNALFAASTPSDNLNEWAETVFTNLHNLGIPAYTNLNIRSEFLELQRRVLIPEGLVSFYDEKDKKTLSLPLNTQLSQLKSKKDRATREDRLFKFGEQRIKYFRNLFATSDNTNAWELFCADFLSPYISTAWEDTIETLNIKFAGTRAIESREFFNRAPNWKDMADIIGRFGIGSADAMIVNFFLCSNFKLIVTGDEDVVYAVERLSNGTKFVLVDGKEQSRLQLGGRAS